MSVIGPGARGAVVCDTDSEAAVHRRLELEREGVPSATLAELGLDTPAPPEDPARFWADALRRPAVVGGTMAGPSTPAQELDPTALKRLIAEHPPRRVAVFGGAWVEASEREHAEAVELGAALARAGVSVVSGGYRGIMEAVSRGAAEAAGMAVGVTIGGWGDRAAPNRWLTHEARARDLFARLPLICDAEAWVAFSGGAGTLAEIALCWNILQADPEPNRPMIVVGDRWGRAFGALREALVVVDPDDFDLVRLAASGEEAAALAISL